LARAVRASHHSRPRLNRHPATAAADAGDAGEPTLTYKTSWLGEWLLPEDARARNLSLPLDEPGIDAFERQKRRWIHPRIDSIWVDPSNGRIYTNTTHPVEASRTLGVYRYDPTTSALMVR